MNKYQLHSSFFNTHSSMRSLPSEGRSFKNHSSMLNASNSVENLPITNNRIIDGFTLYCNNKQKQNSILSRYKKMPRMETVRQFYIQSKNNMKNFSSLLSKEKPKNDTKSILLKLFQEGHSVKKYSDDEDDEDNKNDKASWLNKEKELFILTNNIKTHSFLTDKFTKAKSLKDSKIVIKPKFNITGLTNSVLMNRKLGEKIFTLDAEEQIEKCLYETSKIEDEKMKLKLMPKVKSIGNIIKKRNKMDSSNLFPRSQTSKNFFNLQR